MQRAMALVSKLPEGMQEGVMAFGMRAMQDPHLVAAATLPAAVVLAYVPHFVRIGAYTLAHTDYPIEEPRQMLRPGAPQASSSGIQALLRRCIACHENALEGFAPFAAAVVAAKLFVARGNKRAARTAAALAIRYLLSRVVYTALYLGGVHRAIAVLRTLTWGYGANAVFGLFALALRG